VITYNEFLKENKTESDYDQLTASLLSVFDYYETEDKNIKKEILEFTKNIIQFPNTKVISPGSYYIKYPKGSNELVYHLTNTKFDKFNTPAFFGSADAAYDGNYKYSCILNIENPLELRHSKLGDKKFIDLISDIFKNDDKLEERIKFAKEYGDAYGFFKLLYSENFGNYRWDLIIDYLNENGYDGAIYKESDQTISYYFDGYLVLKPEQIKILALTYDNVTKLNK